MNKNARRTYITYFGFLLVILVLAGYSARNVVFRPWTARSWAAAASAANRVYLFGGRNAQNELMQDILAVDPAQNTLKRVGKQPTGLFGSAAAALDGQLYVAGGTSKGGISNTIERFDPATRSLTTLGILPGPRTYGRLVSAKGSLFYLGGWDGKATSDDIIRIDPASGTSRIVGHLPTALEEFAAASDRGVVYLVGGMNAAGDFVRTIYGIQAETGAVVAKGVLPQAAARMSAAALDGIVYAAGGWNGTQLTELLRIERDGSRLTAKVITTIHFPILDASLAAADNRLYLIGGREQRYRRQVQVLRIDPRTGKTADVLLRSYAWW